MKKNISAIALAVAGIATQDAFATVSNSVIALGSQIQIGCTAPSAIGGVVYSIDASALNTYTQVSDAIALPSGVSTSASCSYALNQIQAQTSVGGSAAGRWLAAGSIAGSPTAGASPVNLTIPGSGYSLQAFTFIAQ